MPEVEWIVATFSLPSEVMEDGEVYRPESLIFMDDDGGVLSLDVVRPGEAPGVAYETLRRAMERPMIGEPHSPSRLRVSSLGVAEALRAACPDLEIAHAPTPEVDAVRALMSESSGELSGPPLPEIAVEALREFLVAAADLHRFAPWTRVPADFSVLGLSVPALGLHDAALLILGSVGPTSGFIVFDDLDQFADYLEACEAMAAGLETGIPPHLVLSYEPEDECAWAPLAAASGVELPGVVPVLFVSGELEGDPPSAEQVQLATAVARALPRALADEASLSAAWHGDEPLARRLEVDTRAGPVEVVLRAPHPRAPSPFREPQDLMAALIEASGDDEERFELNAALLRRFDASPEAKGLAGEGWADSLLSFGLDYCGRTISEFDAHDVDEIVFSIIPRKVSVEAEAAAEIIAELRAFFRFLMREYELPGAAECLQRLSGDAVEALHGKLSDPRNFGMAKTFFTSGLEAGYDMRSEAGVAAWMKEANSSLAREPKPKLTQAEKNKRKAARRGRKKKKR